MAGGETKSSEAVICLGFEPEHPSMASMNFRSPETLLDYDLVIWDPGWLLDEYSLDYPSEYQGRPLLSKGDSALVAGEFSRRKREMVELLKIGGVVVILASAPETVYVHTGQTEHSGTGKNRQTTNIVRPLSFAGAHPVSVDLVEAHGSQIEFKGTEPFGAFWRAHKDAFRYRAYFNNRVGTPQLFVRRTDRPVASVAKAEKGWVVYLPDFVYDVPEGPEKERADAREKAAMDGIIDLASALRQEGGDYSLPDWSKRYQLEGEAEAVDHLAKAGKSVERARKKQDVARRGLTDLEERKLLFTGTGPALEAQVRRAFEALGCDVETGDPGRADLVVRSEDRVAVVEVKGLAKSARESNAAQLEKWVSIHLEQEGSQPKGILVVNAFKELELSRRDGPTFPDQMLDYCVARGHCLLTGGQLLLASIEASKDPDNGPELVASIFGCIGVYDRYEDWAHILGPDEDSNLDVDSPA